MLEALKMHRPTVEPHVNMAPFEESEDIQDFIEAFERVMNIQKIDQKEWVLRLNTVIKGKSTNCLYRRRSHDGVKKAILSQYSVSPERCRAHTPADLSM